MIGVNVPIPVPLAFYSFGGWKESLFGDHHIHGPEGVKLLHAREGRHHPLARSPRPGPHALPDRPLSARDLGGVPAEVRRATLSRHTPRRGATFGAMLRSPTALCGMIGCLAVAAPPAAAIPPAKAFSLPSVNTCVSKRAMILKLRSGTAWAGATIKVGGKRVKTVGRAATKTPIRLRGLPRGRFTLSITAHTVAGGSAQAERRYVTCVDARPKIAAPAGTPPPKLVLRTLAPGATRKAKPVTSSRCATR